MLRLRVWVLAIVILALAPRPLADEQHSHGAVDVEKFGRVSLPTSCSPAAQKQIDRAVAMLHSFWYEAADNTFSEAATTDPACGMAHWGVAMSQLHPLWPTPTPNLARGVAAIAKAQEVGAKTERERDYIAALAVFYKDSDKLDFPTRIASYAKAMEQVAKKYPDDTEATIFSALALRATADPKDKTFAIQKQVGALLDPLFAKMPDHPGLAHYIIHNYDYPQLAKQGLEAARRYALIAPAVPHALHMPSHIFTRLGLWDESISSNRASYSAAKEAATKLHMKSAIGEQLHAMDYLEYAYLQEGQESEARKVRDETLALLKTLPNDMVSNYATAAIPARYAIESKHWKEAAELEPGSNLMPAVAAMTWLARGLGAARTGDRERAAEALKQLEGLRAKLAEKDPYWAEQAEVQRREVAAWLAFAEDRNDEAVLLLRSAADLEDSTEKHPVTPGAIEPAREMLGDMYLALRQPMLAIPEYERALESAPNRFNALYGVARSAELIEEKEKAKSYYSKLLAVSAGHDERFEVQMARNFLGIPDGKK